MLPDKPGGGEQQTAITPEPPGPAFPHPQSSRVGPIVMRRAAAALLMTEQNFRKVMGCRDLGMLKSSLDLKEVVRQRETA